MGRWRRFSFAAVVAATMLALPVSTATVATAAATTKVANMKVQECNKLVARAVVQKSLADFLTAHQAIKKTACSVDGRFITVTTEPSHITKVAADLTGVIQTLPRTQRSCFIPLSGPDLRVLIGATWQIDTRSGNKRFTEGRNNTNRGITPWWVDRKEMRLYVNGSKWASTYDDTPAPQLTWNYTSPWFTPATRLEAWGNANAYGTNCSTTTAFPQ